jgi:hypothetical protein
MQNGRWYTGSVRSPVIFADMNADGVAEEVKLVEQQGMVISKGEIIYQSSPDWRVRQIEFADLNRDGSPEAVLLVWRPFKPWPIDRLLPAPGRINEFHDKNGKSCHIILVGWKNGVIREAWAGSALADPVISFSIADLNGDGWEDLATIEGDYSLSAEDFGKTVKIWEWNGFGFSRLEQIDIPARQMIITKNTDGKPGIIIAVK